MEMNEKLTETLKEEIPADNQSDLLYQPKPLFNTDKRDIIFSLCALVISIFASVLGIFGGFALGHLLSILIMFSTITVYFAKGAKINATSIICGLVSLLNTAVFICTTNSSVKFFAALTNLLLMLVFFDGLINPPSKGNRQTFQIFLSAASTIGNIDITVKSLFSKVNGEKKTLGKFLIGLACAVPVLIIVVPLLISSDDAFEGLITNIFSNCFLSILKALLGIVISIFIISYTFSTKTRRIYKMKETTFDGIDNIYLISFLSTISLCYILYLFSQLAYFFSAFRGFLPNGEITYAQYARKGFFEMCIIAIINLCIVALSLILSKKKNGKPSHLLKALTTYISFFTLIIIATSISKMVLYIDAYGMTILRLTTGTFMLFLAVVFISLIFRIFITKINIIKTALITAGCITFILGLVNVNTVCAMYNYNAYKSNRLENIDVKAIYELGDEGIPYIIKLSTSDDRDTAIQARRYLSKAYLYDYFDNMDTASTFTVNDLQKNQKNNNFQYFSIPKNTAYKNLYNFIEKNPKFASYCQYYYNIEEGYHYR